VHLDTPFLRKSNRIIYRYSKNGCELPLTTFSRVSNTEKEVAIATIVIGANLWLNFIVILSPAFLRRPLTNKADKSKDILTFNVVP
jgi:hypothetical protein